MMKWAQGALSAVAGTAEPIYGPEAIRSVTKQAETTPYTELDQKDAEWLNMGKTSVETQTFYLHADAGHIGVVQVIHSSVMGISTSQFTLKVFHPRSENKPHLWSSNALSDIAFENDGKDYIAGDLKTRSADSTEEFHDLEVRLSEDGNSYYITSFVNPESNVNLKVTRTAPGFQVGNDGTSYYGDEAPPNHWGSMRHRFWPRCEVTGTIHSEPDSKTKESKMKVDFKGKAMLSHALQGMKPHHAAGKWKFADFQGPTYSAVMMEFTTPPSYGSTVVNVGGIVRDGEIITAGAPQKGEHTKKKSDSENDWPEPEAIRYTWNGKTKDGKAVEAVIEGPLGERLDRIDVMAEVPGFVKTIVASAAGTKPYIYQYSPPTASLKIKVGENEVIEEGKLFTEATFITE